MKKKLGSIIFILILTFYSLNDLRAQWVSTGGPDSGLIINDLASIGTNIFACDRTWNYAPDRLFLSNDNGIHWRVLQQGGVMTLAVEGSHIFAGSLYYGLGLSQDTGNGWGMVFGWQGQNDVWTTGNTLFFSSDHYGLQISTDSGAKWDSLAVPGLSDIAEYNGVMFGKDSSGLLRSTDRGMNWKKVQGLPPDSTNGYEFAISGTNIFCASVTGIYRSIDSGATWISASNGLPGGISSFLGIDPLLAANNKFVFVATIKGVYHSSDEGISWSQWNDGLGSDTITAFTINDTFIFAGTQGQGVWRRPLSEVDINDVKNPSSSESNISLSPNPTTGILSIRNAPENLTGISILNVLGQEVIQMTAPHSADFTIDLSKLPAGMYYARIATEGSVEVRKIIKE